jgi:hypothetical protein
VIRRVSRSVLRVTKKHIAGFGFGCYADAAAIGRQRKGGCEMKDLRLFFIALVMIGAGVFYQSAQPADAAFHLMRIHAVMAGLNGDPQVQFVELRMCSSGQPFVSGHDLDFYDAVGTLKARFTFPGNVGNSNNGDSILIATFRLLRDQYDGVQRWGRSPSDPEPERQGRLRRPGPRRL